MWVPVSLLGLVAASCSSAASSGSTPVAAKAEASSTTTVVPALERSPGVVLVNQVELPVGGGFVAVYSDGGGVPGGRLGASDKLAAGAAGGIEVMAEGNGAVWVMVHRDVDGDGVLTFPGVDAVLTDPISGAIRTELVQPDSAAAVPEVSVR